MGFELLSEQLKNKGLRNPNLDLLRKDASLYKSLLLQPVESVEYANDFIRIANRGQAKAKFRSFFQTAIEQDIELAITPEYSCPWEIIEELVQNIDGLKENQIWVTGCESIKALELHDLAERNPQIAWIYEADKVETNLANDHFFNPVCYIFKTRSEQNELKAVVTVQFKTHHFGGADMEWERDNFIPGDKIYIIENSEDSSRLVTFICSDTLNTSPDFNITHLPQFSACPYLIIHIQINKSPYNIDFSQYRRDTYRMRWGNKEFICLNWGRNILIDGSIWNHYGGSALYIQAKPDEEIKFNICDQRINSNHKAGLYYSRWSNRKAHLYFLNYDEHVFLLRNTKPSQSDALPATRSRSGPEMLGIYSWNNDNNEWQSVDTVDDGFSDICDEFYEIEDFGDYNTLKSLHAERPIDVERLIYLSLGKAQGKDWYLPTVNDFFRIDDNEINKRITFTHNPVPYYKQAIKDHLNHYGILEYTIITNPNYLPDSLSDLKNNCIIHYRENGYENEFNLNLFPINDVGVPASGAFIGIKTKRDAVTTLMKMTELFQKNHFGKRTVVWYVDNTGEILQESNNEKAKITENTSASNRSIRSIRSK